MVKLKLLMPIRKSGLNFLQKLSMTFMAVLAILTFVGANLHALLWQSSDWLVSTILPAVVVELTNEEREDNEASPLRRNATLDKAATLKAQHMAENEYFSHFSPDGVSPWYWFREAGYLYAHAGENLAVHFTDSTEVVEAWMDSPTHRANIVNDIYTEIGVGTAKGTFDGYDTVYVVQLFGTPAIPPAVDSEPPIETPETALAPVPEAQPTAIANTVETRPETPETVVITNPELTETIPQPDAVATQPTNTPVNDNVPLSEEPTVTAEELVANDNIQLSSFEDGLVAQTEVLNTSSGLLVADLEETTKPHAGATIASIATSPSLLLQAVYTVLTLVVVGMLGTSIVMEARRLNYQQVAYGFLLLFGMGGLWYLHALLTTGAVIV
jgi:hypothetical protein